MNTENTNNEQQEANENAKKATKNKTDYDLKTIEKNLKKHSLNMYKIQLELKNIVSNLDSETAKELNKNIKLINKLDNDLLKAFEIKFTNQQKEDFIDLMN